MARFPVRSTLAALVATVLLAGCKGLPGSTLAYKPRQGERRPDPAFRADEEERLALKNAVPVEIDRTEAYFEQGRREQSRIKASTPRNPWDDHENDLMRVIGPDLTRKELGGRLPRPRPGAAAPAAAPAEGESEEGEGEGESE